MTIPRAHTHDRLASSTRRHHTKRVLARRLLPYGGDGLPQDPTVRAGPALRVVKELVRVVGPSQAAERPYSGEEAPAGDRPMELQDVALAVLALRRLTWVSFVQYFTTSRMAPAMLPSWSACTARMSTT